MKQKIAMTRTHTNNRLFASEWLPVLALICIFAGSRIWFAWAGGEFIDSPLDSAKQFLSPVLLQQDLLSSLWYLHSQPPLFNLFLGLVLKTTADPGLVYELFFRISGLLIPLCMYGTLVILGANRIAAFLVTFFFMLNPSLILYESLLYYTHVEGVLIMAAVFFLARWGLRKTTFDLIVFWLLLVCLGLTRSLFHPVFFVVLGVVLCLFIWYQNRPTRAFRMVFMAAMIPLMLWCLKNLLIFGFFGTSSWAGMSLWVKTNGYAPEHLEQFHALGLISQVAVRADQLPFREIGDFTHDGLLQVDACHHPADCCELRPKAWPNYNHIGYVALSRQLGRDALQLIRHDPETFLFSTLSAFSLSLWYASDSAQSLFQKNMAVLEPLEDFYRYAFFGFLDVKSRHSDPRLWVRAGCIGLLFAVFYGLTIFQAVRRQKNRERFALVLVCLFCMLTHVFVLLISSGVEFGENPRFRFPVDGAFVILVAGNLLLLRRQR